jgi:hypothetical protein
MVRGTGDSEMTRKKTPAARAAVKKPRRLAAAPPRPLRKPFAVVVTRLLGEYATREEAELVQRHYVIEHDDQWITLISAPPKKEKRR